MYVYICIYTYQHCAGYPRKQINKYKERDIYIYTRVQQMSRYFMFFKVMSEGSLEVKLLTIWTDKKQRWEESEKKARKESQKREEKKKT